MSLRDHLLATGTKHCTEASPYDILWGFDIRADCTDVADPTAWIAQPLPCSSLQDACRLLTIESSGSVEATPPLSRLSANADVKDEGVEYAFLCLSISRCFSSFEELFKDASFGSPKFEPCLPEDRHQDVLHIMIMTKANLPYSSLVGEGQCSIDGVVSVDDASFTTRFHIHSGHAPASSFTCVWHCLTRMDAAPTFVAEDVWKHMKSPGPSEAASERVCESRSS